MDDQNHLREIIRQQVELTGDLVRDAMSGIKAEFQVMIDACRKPHEPTFGDMAASFGLIARVALLTELALCPNEGRRIAVPRGLRLCPVQALERWLAAVAGVASAGCRAGGDCPTAPQPWSQQIPDH